MMRKRAGLIAGMPVIVDDDLQPSEWEIEPPDTEYRIILTDERGNERDITDTVTYLHIKMIGDRRIPKHFRDALGRIIQRNQIRGPHAVNRPLIDTVSK